MTARWIAGGVLCIAGAAAADTVDMTYIGQGAGRSVHVTLGNQQFDTFAGRLNHHVSNGTGVMSGGARDIVTFCVDLFQNQTPSASSYATSSVATLSGNTGLTNLGFAKQQAIYDVYQAAAGRQFTLGLDYATAFQVAVWEIVYDYNASLPNHGLNVGIGTFRATAPGQTTLSASITEKVNFLLGSVGINAGAHGLIGLKSAAFQDQLFSPQTLPLPSGAWLGAAGLGLAGLARRIRRR